jgi:hypothetical protein
MRFLRKFVHNEPEGLSLKALAVFQAFNLVAALQNREFQGCFSKN